MTGRISLALAAVTSKILNGAFSGQAPFSKIPTTPVASIGVAASPPESAGWHVGWVLHPGERGNVYGVNRGGEVWIIVGVEVYRYPGRQTGLNNRRMSTQHVVVQFGQVGLLVFVQPEDAPRAVPQVVGCRPGGIEEVDKRTVDQRITRMDDPDL